MITRYSSNVGLRLLSETKLLQKSQTKPCIVAAVPDGGALYGDSIAPASRNWLVIGLTMLNSAVLTC
jgi:hypothetical protein